MVSGVRPSDNGGQFNGINLRRSLNTPGSGGTENLLLNRTGGTDVFQPNLRWIDEDINPSGNVRPASTNARTESTDPTPADDALVDATDPYSSVRQEVDKAKTEDLQKLLADERVSIETKAIVMKELIERLKELQKNPDANADQIRSIEASIKEAIEAHNPGANLGINPDDPLAPADLRNASNPLVEAYNRVNRGGHDIHGNYQDANLYEDLKSVGLEGLLREPDRAWYARIINPNDADGDGRPDDMRLPIAQNDPFRQLGNPVALQRVMEARQQQGV